MKDEQQAVAASSHRWLNVDQSVDNSRNEDDLYWGGTPPLAHDDAAILLRVTLTIAGQSPRPMKIYIMYYLCILTKSLVEVKRSRDRCTRRCIEESEQLVLWTLC